MLCADRRLGGDSRETVAGDGVLHGRPLIFNGASPMVLAVGKV